MFVSLQRLKVFHNTTLMSVLYFLYLRGFSKTNKCNYQEKVILCMKECSNEREVYVPPQTEILFLPNPLNMLRYFSSDVGDWNGSGDPLEGDWDYDEALDDFLNGGTAGNDGY